MKRLFVLFFLLFACVVTDAQVSKNVNKWVAKGEKAEKKGNFEKAISYYKLVEKAYKECDTIDDVLGETLSALGFLYLALADYSIAVEYGIKTLEVNKDLLGESHPNYATSLADLALFYEYLGDYSMALEYGTKALEIRRAVLGDKHLDYATSLSDLADFYSDSGDYLKAVEYSTKALEIKSTVLGENHPDNVESLFICSKSYFNLGNYTKAIELGTKAAEIDKAIGEDDLNYAKLLENLAIIYSKISEYSKALGYGKQAMEIRKAVLGENHPDFANSLSVFALIYNLLGDYSKAVEYEKKAMEIRKTVLGEKNPNYAVSLSNLANFYFGFSDYSNALEYEKQAMKIRKVVLGENHPDYATSVGNLALYYSALGDYSKSAEYYNRALEILKTSLGESHPEYATLLSNIADFYSDLGDYSRALEYSNKAIEIKKTVFGENHPDYAWSLNTCARIYSEFGDYVKAIEYSTKALEIRRTVLGENHPDYVNSMHDLAYSYSNLGDYFKALEYGKKVVEIDKVKFGENHPEYAMSISNLATYYSNLGILSTAIEYGTKAMSVFKTQFGENHLYYAKSLKKLSSYYLSFGDYSKAMECLKECLSIEKNNILSVFSFFPAFQRTLYWNKYSADFTDVYPALLYKYGYYDTSDLYNQSALFAKGLLLSTNIEIKKLIFESGDNEAMRMYEELRLKRMELQKLYKNPIAERFIYMDSLKAMVNQMDKKLIECSKVYGDYTKKQQTAWQDVQQSLAENELAVEFLSFNVNGTDSIIVSALTLRYDDTKPKFFPLFELRELQELSDTVNFISPNLTTLVWQPLHDELYGIKTIYFSPAGVFHKIGIEYAPGMEDYEIYRLSSTREIIDLKDDKKSSGKPHSDAVLYGGIEYDLSGHLISPDVDEMIVTNDSISQQIAYSMHRAFIDSLDLRGAKISFLPSTLTEVQNISSSLKQANYPTIVHVGTDATETSVKALSGKAPSILHISTHGFYFSEKQAKKKEYLKFMGFEGQKNVNEEDKALSRSGLLMAGANRSLEGEDIPINDDDGILTAQEISLLDLRGTDLVVLSACETGRGDIMQGEGVFGLQRGFKKAGAKSILMSQWKVSDIATEMLMTEFYKNYCEGKSKRESLRLAQKKVREYKDDEGNLVFQDPHYWAGFVMLD